MKILDRYIIRETLGPFALALVLFTFLIAIQPMLSQAEVLIAKGAPIPTVGFLLLTLLPHALGLTIPMAFLAATVMALGRLSGDREAVALLACGVSPLRMLRPVLVLATAAAAATAYVLISVMPAANQAFLDITFDLTRKMAAQDVKPRLFYEGFTGRAILIEDKTPDGRWLNVMLADTSQPGRPSVQFAREGRLVIDEERRLVNIVLDNVAGYRPLPQSDEYEYRQAERTVLQIDPGVVFNSGGQARQFNAMSIAELQVAAAQKVEMGMSPHPEIIAIQQRYSFPVACFVFALIGLSLGLHTRKEGKLGGFVIGLLVILAYNTVMVLFEGRTKALEFPPEWARWMPNIILGLVGVVLLVFKMRGTSPRLELRLPAWAARFRGAAPEESTPGASASGKSPAPVVLVIRLPHLGLPRPQLLDVYVTGRYLRTLALAFFGLLSLYYIVEFVELSEKIQKGNATMAMVMEYFYFATPTFVYFVVPLATLVAVLTTFGGLSRSNELTVMRACGVSLYRTAAPILLFALAWSGVMFGLEDRVLAHSQRRAEALRDRIRDRPPRTFNIANRNWLVDREGRLYYYAVYDARQQTLHQLSVFDLNRETFRLRAHTTAAKVSHVGGEWQAVDGTAQTFGRGTRVTREPFAERVLDLAPPEEIGTEQVEAALMNYGELKEYIDRLGESGFNIREHEVELHRKTAFPFVTLVMTLLAVPFGVTTGRRGALYGIGLAMGLAVSYLLISYIFIAFGNASVLPPALAAWATNGLFAGGALFLLFTVRT